MVDLFVMMWMNVEIVEMVFVCGIGNCVKVKVCDVGIIKKLNEKYGDASWTKYFVWALLCV